MRIPTALTLALALPASVAPGAQAPINVDGRFDDWSAVALAASDPQGDGGGGGSDLVALHLADDARFLFLRLEVADDFDLSEDNELRIYLDTDDDAGTGLAIGGIGAELEWRPGARTGTFYGPRGGSTTVSQADIRFRGAPTVTSAVFEMAIGRDTLPDGADPLFDGAAVRVRIVDGASGDTLPGGAGGVAYSLDEGTTPPVEPRSFARLRPGDLRVLTHNVLNDGVHDPDNADAYERLYGAVDPDIVFLQEVYDHDAAETAQLLTGWLGGTWFASDVSDCQVVSRFPILGTQQVDGNNVSLVDTTAALGTPLLCVSAHLPCCTNDTGRQDEVDAIVAAVREAYAPGPPFDLGPEVPVIIAGDLNLVGLAQQLVTLVTGDIQDESTYGPDHPLDPDGTPMTDLVSRQTEKRMAYTWRSDGSSFWPGRLDFLIFSDSNVAVGHDFIVYTPEMSPTELAGNGLQAGDALVSDHLMFCADFRAPCAADFDGNGAVGFADLLVVLGTWGPCTCAADLDGNGAVDFADLLAVLGAWGDC